MRIHQDVLTFKFFVATWNVAGKSPQDSLNLDDFLQVHDLSDVYILGFQEIVPLNAGNVLVTEGSGTAAKWLFWISQSLNQFTHAHSFSSSSSSSSSSLFPCQKKSLKAACKIYRGEHVRGLKNCNCNFTSPWERKSSKDNCFNCQQSSISEDDFSSEEDIIDVPITFVDSKFTSPSRSSSKQRKYSLVVCKQMVGVFLTVWVRTELLPHISHLRTSSVSRGIMGCLGNKGCISVSMSFYQTSFCFICSHLTSGEKDGDELRRNLDVIEILKNTQFPNISRTSNCRAPLRIEEHDRAIWLGDLNYRIALSHSETRQLVEKNDWDALLNKDQLKLERGAGRVFKGWKEGRIYFAPTYKYSYNSDIYTAAETTKSKNNKRRSPAWCDRILWHGNGIRQLSYVRREIRFSDHRPVCSTFLLDVRPFSRNTS